jgi:SNF2 family DNA or RNA helicase
VLLRKKRYKQKLLLQCKMTASLASITKMENREKKHGNASCKIVFLMALLDNLIAEDHRVLVFSQTQKMLNIIQEEVRSKGYNFLWIDGTSKACNREKFVNEFQVYGKIPIFLLTSQVGGLGITLIGSDRVVIVDPAWNPSTDNQSVDHNMLQHKTSSQVQDK